MRKGLMLWLVIGLGALLACNGSEEQGGEEGQNGDQPQENVEGRGFSSAGPISDLQPTRVVLYRNGVGYVERQGSVDGTSLKLRVRPDQINDILKSLTVVDTSGGKAISIALPVQKTDARLRQELPEAIRDPKGLKALIGVFRGAHVTVDGHDGPTDARIVGIEEVSQPGPDGKMVEAWQITLLTEEGTLVPMDLSEVRGLVLKDKTLFAGLEQSLNISLDSGNWKPVELAIQLTEGSHELMVSYIVEMPMWKPTYRLVTGQNGKTLLQGWAVVDNVTGEDWNNVQLSLVTGEPLSFTYDLHSPRYRTRPDLTPRHLGAAHVPPKIRSMRRKKEMSKSMAPSPSAATVDLLEDSDDGEGFGMGNISALKDSVQTMVTGTEIGGLFQYDISEPISVPDRSAALVSIVTQEVPGNDVHLFHPISESFVNLKPYRAIHFQNTTPFTLEEGPVALHRGSTFVGEGMLSRVPADSNQFIPYAMDNTVTLSASRQEKEEAVGILKVLDGVITSQLRRVRAVTYSVKNTRQEETTVYVRRTRRAGWTIRKPAEGVLESGGWWYVPVVAAANTETTLNVEEATPVEKRVRIESKLSTELLNVYLGSHEVSPELKATLDKVLKIKKRLALIQTDIDHLTAEKKRWLDSQRRVRANLERLNESDGNARLKRDQSKKLADLDDKISKLVAKLVKLDDDKAKSTAKLSILFEDVELAPAKKDSDK